MHGTKSCENMCMLQVVGAVGFMNQRLSIPDNLDPEWANMMKECWDKYEIFLGLRIWVLNVCIF